MNSTLYRWILVIGITPLSLIVSILVIRRTPGNVTGLFLLLWSVLNLGQAVPADSPLNIYNRAFNTGWTGLWLLALYFPNGRAYPLRFERWIRGLSAWTVLIVSAWYFFQPTVNNWNYGDPTTLMVANPFFIPALKPFLPVVNVLDAISFGLVILLIIPSILLRYRDSSQTERLQIKWLGWTYGILIASLVFYVPSGLLSGDPNKYGIPGLIAYQAFGIFVALAPYISVGNAILRHRLYDIDIVIRRTLQYGILTALLLLLYFGSVTVLHGVFTALGGSQSTAATVISTLAIAALFNPLRRRVQDFIDRRFYRRKYDAQKTLEEFAAIARSEVEMEPLTQHLLAVVENTMQSEGVSLWLRPSGRGKLGALEKSS